MPDSSFPKLPVQQILILFVLTMGQTVESPQGLSGNNFPWETFFQTTSKDFPLLVRLLNSRTSSQGLKFCAASKQLSV